MICETNSEEMMKRYVVQKLSSNRHFVAQKSKAELMLELVSELRHLRDNMFVPRGRLFSFRLCDYLRTVYSKSSICRNFMKENKFYPIETQRSIL